MFGLGMFSTVKLGAILVSFVALSGGLLTCYNGLEARHRAEFELDLIQTHLAQQKKRNKQLNEVSAATNKRVVEIEKKHTAAQQKLVQAREQINQMQGGAGGECSLNCTLPADIQKIWR